MKTTENINNRHSICCSSSSSSGITLIELVLTIVLMGILVTVTFRSAGYVDFTSKTEETKQEMDMLAEAIVGNPELHNNGVRTDFGYIGDVGSLPPNLDALVQNPGGYSTWQGPYFARRFSQITDDHRKNAWGKAYAYSAGTTVSSPPDTLPGGGCSGVTVTGEIVKTYANSTGDLLRNRVRGTILDLDGTPPGAIHCDSLLIRLTIPNGIGGTLVKNSNTDIGGFFQFDSIPIGNHDLEIIYEPDVDTLRRFVSVLPNSALHRQYRLSENVWFDTSGASGGGGIEKLASSDSLYADCHGFFFWITNTADTTIRVDSVSLTWSSPTAYYRYVKWNGSTVFNRTNPKAASGETVSLSSTQTISSGQNLRVDFDFFKSQPTGGPDVDMNNTAFTVDFFIGAPLNVSTGGCP